ncbi:MAG: hypothetical protein AAGB26_03620 [Planctomycetota bacterium]
MNQPLIAILIACTWGCGRSPQDPATAQSAQDTFAASDTASHDELHRVVALRAYEFIPYDLEETASYYRDHPSNWLTLIDLNHDGINEAIATTTFAVDESGELHLADGVTGNRPFNVFREQDGKWLPMMEEDFWCRDYSIESTKVNGWPVITSTSRLSISEYPVSVYAYEAGAYRIICDHMFRPWEEPTESR